MNVMVVADGHYYKAPNGVVYADSVYNYDFFKRYLQVFDKVYAVARIEHMNIIPEGRKVSSGENVEFLELPAYKGPWQYLKKYFKLSKLSKEYADMTDCGIFRIPSATANIMCKSFAKTKKPYAVELVVDPWEYFAKGTINTITRPLVRYSWTKFVKEVCRLADGVSYVTERYLQNKYPCRAITDKNNSRYFTAHYSSVDLKADSYGYPKRYDQKTKFVISHVANGFATYGKGHLTLMNAVKIVRDEGYDVSIIFVGDGPLKEKFIEYSKKLEIEQYVNFIGKLPDGNAVRKTIIGSDLFIFPTMAEGLPRVLLEAMSVGLPCISSPICGIPEILSKDYLCDYYDNRGFADKIINFITNKDLMEKASVENIETARQYSDVILGERRRKFYSKLRELTENQGV